VVPPHPNRTDIACFVGYVGRRETELPAELDRWLRERGWHLAEHGRTPFDELLDVPVPVDTWDLFDHLFAWDERDLNGQGQLGTAYLGAAVRSFFAQGGRKCYVVRVGDPWPIVDLDRSAPLAEAVRARGRGSSRSAASTTSSRPTALDSAAT